VLVLGVSGVAQMIISADRSIVRIVMRDTFIF
jgi:hypothetical protein